MIGVTQAEQQAALQAHGLSFQGHVVMAPGAEFRVATDIPDYVRQTLEEVPQAGFVLEAEGDQPWSDWLSTRYEQKALREGRDPHYLTFRRHAG